MHGRFHPYGLMCSLLYRTRWEWRGLGCLLGICPEVARNSLGKWPGRARLTGHTTTRASKKGSEKVLGRALGKGSQKGSEKGACYGFCNNKGVREGFSEGVLIRGGHSRKCPERHLAEYDPLGVRPRAMHGTLQTPCRSSQGGNAWRKFKGPHD